MDYQKINELISEVKTKTKELNDLTDQIQAELFSEARTEKGLKKFLSGVAEATEKLDSLDYRIVSVIKTFPEITRKRLTLRFVNSMRSMELSRRLRNIERAGLILSTKRQGKTKPTTVYRAT